MLRTESSRAQIEGAFFSCLSQLDFSWPVMESALFPTLAKCFCFIYPESFVYTLRGNHSNFNSAFILGDCTRPDEIQFSAGSSGVFVFLFAVSERTFTPFSCSLLIRNGTASVIKTRWRFTTDPIHMLNKCHRENI